MSWTHSFHSKANLVGDIIARLIALRKSLRYLLGLDIFHIVVVSEINDRRAVPSLRGSFLLGDTVRRGDNLANGELIWDQYESRIWWIKVCIASLPTMLMCRRSDRTLPRSQFPHTCPILPCQEFSGPCTGATKISRWPLRLQIVSKRRGQDSSRSQQWVSPRQRSS